MEGNLNEQPTLWLDLQPEYIDVNLDKFVQYLFDKIGEGRHDDFYRSSMRLLCSRVHQLWQELSVRPIGDMMDEQGSTAEQVGRQVRILALYVLVEAYANAAELHKTLACIHLLMVRLSPEVEHEALLGGAIRSLTSLGRVVVKFNWNDLRHFEPYLFMKALLRTEYLPGGGGAPQWYAGFGTAMLRDKSLSLMAVTAKEYSSLKMQETLSLCDDRLKILAHPQLKLSQTKSADYEALEQFFSSFQRSMVPAAAVSKPQYRYKAGAQLKVRVRRLSGIDRIEVESIDPEYERVSGLCEYSGKFMYQTRSFCLYLKVGDILLATIDEVDGERSHFDLVHTFWDFLFDEYYYTAVGSTMMAVAMDTVGNYRLWWTEHGFVASVRENGFHEGQVSCIRIVGKEKAGGYINAIWMYNAPEGQAIDREASYREFVEAFCFEPDFEERQSADNPLSPQYLRLFARMVYVLQKNISLPIERYKLLGAVRLLSHMAADDISACYADFSARTLGNMVRFACGQFRSIEVPHPDARIEGLPGVMRRSNIIRVLMQYGDHPDEAFLDAMIDGDDELLRRLAKLVQSGNRLAGVLSGTMQRQIELEITRQLMVDDEADTDLMDGDDDYFGVEDDRKEFKTSFVFPPDNHMQPDPVEQQHNVFKGVCAMLNSREGGVLYLGVNDHGLVSGLTADFTALRLQTMDAYMRHISDAAKRTFGLELMPYIHLESIHEDRVVAIKVEPCDFKIVELDGVAYVRANAESRKMDKATRMYVLNRKVHFDASRARLENALSTAIEHRCQAVLRNYRAIETGAMENVRVEPFAFTKGNKHVWCYDLDKGCVALFALSRIGDVKVEDKPWEHQAEHREHRTDLFHQSEGQPVRIQLTLDAVAYMHLVEEYDGSESQLTNMRDGHWLLDTEVFGMEGVGRFYLGLAGHIDIVNAPGLREYARSYAQRFLLQ